MHNGQAMLEYVLVISSLFLVALIMVLAVDAGNSFAVRTERLVSSNYP